MARREKYSPGPAAEPDFAVVAIAMSAGGIRALDRILQALPPDFPLPMLVAQHRSADMDDEPYIQVLQCRSRLPIRLAAEGNRPEVGTIYVPPAGRHLEVRDDGSLTVERRGRVNNVCPSADLMFESVGKAYGSRAVAVVLSGLGRDGAAGAAFVRDRGGFVIAQDEQSAGFFDMPNAAIETRRVDLVLSADQIAYALCSLARTPDVPMRRPRGANPSPAPGTKG